jgi:hypothetical protein
MITPLKKNKMNILTNVEKQRKIDEKEAIKVEKQRKLDEKKTIKVEKQRKLDEKKTIKVEKQRKLDEKKTIKSVLTNSIKEPVKYTGIEETNKKEKNENIYNVNENIKDLIINTPISSKNITTNLLILHEQEQIINKGTEHGSKYEITDTNLVILPNEIFIQMINNQKQKEEKADIWKDSPYKDLVKLQSNNVGNVGETFIQNMCDVCQIEAQVDGSKTKILGGGIGDGLILNKSIEIKTSHRGSTYSNFQHELGETPWKPEFMVFIDVAPRCVYLTIFKNFDEEFYKSGNKCKKYFPTKSVTWRKGTGAFKLDTTVKINEENIIKGHTFIIDNKVDLNALKTFILLKIE